MLQSKGIYVFQTPGRESCQFGIGTKRNDKKQGDGSACKGAYH